MTGTILAGIGLGALYWLIQSSTDAFLFHKGEFFQQFLHPDRYQLFMRLQAVFLLMFLGAYRGVLVHRIRQAVGNWRMAESAHRELQGQNVRLLRDLECANQMARQAIAADRAKSDFLAMMTHEIRTPLNGIMGMTEVALSTELNPEQRDFLETAKASADSLLQVINDVLDFSRMEAGKLDLDEVSFSLRDCLSDIVGALGLLASRKGLELTCEVGPDVPDALVGDPSRLRQIMVNLIGNAVKFTERGHVKVSVELDPGPAGEARPKADPSAGSRYVRFSVADTGVGVPRENRETIFGAYIQAGDSPPRRYGGSGLGLAICRQLVEIMGGRIWLESEPGPGSTFCFTAHFGLQTGLEISREPARLAHPTNLAGLPVLVVDENAASRRVLEQTLSSWSMEAEAVDGGDSALAKLEEATEAGRDYVLVILDGKATGMDGFALANKIKKDATLSASSLIMIKSSGERGDGARCRELGIAAYLTRPIRQLELLQAITTILDKDPSDEGHHELVTRHTLREARRRLRILLAEDDAVNRKFALRALEQTGHTVVVAENGKEAVAAFGLESFDLVLMDVQMPGMNGLEAAAEIRKQEVGTGGHIPIIAMTAGAWDGDRQRCLDAGMDGYLGKPLTLKALHELMDDFLGAGPVSRVGWQAPPASHSTPADWGRVRRMAEDDPECEQELLNLFVSQTRERLSFLDTAVREGDGARIEEVAHGLKGACGNLDAKNLEHLAHELERVGASGNLDSTREIFQALLAEWHRVERYLLDYRKSPKSVVPSP